MPYPIPSPDRDPDRDPTPEPNPDQVTLKLRHLLLRQNKITNRFEGSSFARHAEMTYA